MKRIPIFVFLAAASISAASAFQASPTPTQAQSPQDHIQWVTQALMRMETIKPGMTREELLTVFTTEGGLSNAKRRVYVSRDCPYFKVDVEFQTAGGTELLESGHDVILKISRPYLQFSILD